MAAGYATVALLLLLTVVTAVLGVRRLADRTDTGYYHAFLLILMGGAFGLGMGVDLITTNNDIDRMNTVFKLYLQAWVLFGLASATALWYLAASARLSWRGLLGRKGAWPGVPLVVMAFLSLAAAAFLVGMIVDLVVANMGFDRLRTLLKLHPHAWVLFGLAAATVLAYLASAALLSWRNFLWGKGLWLSVLIVLVAATAVFPLLGTRARLADRFSTEFTGLNGARYMEGTIYDDANGLITLKWDWEAIHWLRENVEGSPVLAEGNTSPHNYRWGSRISIYTGLPTIVGWDWHQAQQRHGEEQAVRRRLADLMTLYTATDIAQAERILRDYDVKYIYVGELERLYYPRDGLDKFNLMKDKGVALVYTNQEVEIYQVNLVF